MRRLTLTALRTLATQLVPSNATVTNKSPSAGPLVAQASAAVAATRAHFEQSKLVSVDKSTHVFHLELAALESLLSAICKEYDAGRGCRIEAWWELWEAGGMCRLLAAMLEALTALQDEVLDDVRQQLGPLGLLSLVRVQYRARGYDARFRHLRLQLLLAVAALQLPVMLFSM